MQIYPAIFTTNEDNITITFPDIPEAITQGKYWAETYKMAQEVLGMVIPIILSQQLFLN